MVDNEKKKLSGITVKLDCFFFYSATFAFSLSAVSFSTLLFFFNARPRSTLPQGLSSLSFSIHLRRRWRDPSCYGGCARGTCRQPFKPLTRERYAIDWVWLFLFLLVSALLSMSTSPFKPLTGERNASVGWLVSEATFVGTVIRVFFFLFLFLSLSPSPVHVSFSARTT